MRKFDGTKLGNRIWDSEIAGYAAQIHEYKEKQQVLLKQLCADKAAPQPHRDLYRYSEIEQMRKAVSAIILRQYVKHLAAERHQIKVPVL